VAPQPEAHGYTLFTEGRFAVLNDPQGAAFSIIALSNPS
jgi:hypothetical protein